MNQNLLTIVTMIRVHGELLSPSWYAEQNWRNQKIIQKILVTGIEDFHTHFYTASFVLLQYAN